MPSVARMFTPQVLAGTRLAGLSIAEVAKALRLAPDAVESLLSGRRRLTQKQAELLERATGRTVAHLAFDAVVVTASPQSRAKNSASISRMRDLLDSLNAISPKVRARKTLTRSKQVA